LQRKAFFRPILFFLDKKEIDGKNLKCKAGIDTKKPAKLLLQVFNLFNVIALLRASQ
jgi:hypothetical protein